MLVTIPFRLPSVLAALVGLAVAGPALAQAPPAGPAPAATKPAAAAPQKTKQPAAPSNEAALQQRVDQLEEQLIDLQVVIGTLESLAKQPAAQAAPSSNDAQRIQALEAQLKSLSAQIEQMGEKARSAGEPTKQRSDIAPPTRHAGPEESEPSTASFGSATVTSSHPDAPAEPAQPRSPQAPQAYETAPGTSLPPIGSEPAAATAQGPADQPGADMGADMAALPPSADPGDSKHDYEVAYSHVIQRDYGAAQAGFTDFMKRYPKDPLVPNALYWLGETHYQQRNFADAAEAFDLVTKLYASSPKAADSQLKRALSFSALGKNNEACAALTDLNAKFQNAPTYVKTRAGSERRRLGCSG